MNASETIEAAADAAESPDALQNARALLRNKFKAQPKIERIQRERKSRANVERIDGRSIRPGSERQEQFNFTVRGDLKERLKHYCKGKGIKLADWLEQQIMQALEGQD